MTAIAGLIYNGTVLMGADSGITEPDSDRISLCTSPKVFDTDYNILIGFAGALCVGQIMQYIFEPPEPKTIGMEYMVRQFIPAMRAVMVDHGFDGDLPADLLVGMAGGLFHVGEDYGVHQAKEDYAAIGTGSSYVLGSLYTSTDWEITPRDRIIVALSAAARHCSSVCSPYKVLRT